MTATTAFQLSTWSQKQGPPRSSGHAAEILAVEPTGAETHIVAHVAGCEVMIALRKCIALRPGDRLTVSALPSGLHFFDANTSLRIN